MGLNRAETTQVLAKDNPNDRFAMAIMGMYPLLAGLACGTGSLLGFPINGEVIERKALILTGLPPGIRTHRTKQVNFILPLTYNQILCTHIAAINDMDCWQTIFVPQGLVNGSYHHIILRGRHGGFDLRDEARLGWITRFSEMDFVAFPGCRALLREAGLGIIRRADHLG